MNILRHKFLETSQEGTEGGGGGEDDSARQTQVEQEREARKIGWRPKEQFKGNQDDWVDAGEFLDRGKTFIPFLNAERHRLQGDLGQRDSRIQQLEGRLQAQNEQIEELRGLHKELAEDRKEHRKTEIGTELRAAREAGDDVRVAELQNELAEIVKPDSAKTGNGSGNETRQQTPPGPQLQPWLKSWIDGNQESLRNPRFAGLFNGVVAEKRAAGDQRGLNNSDGTELMEEVKAEVHAILNPNTRRAAPGKSEETRSTGGGGGAARGTGRSFADLPADAKTKCDKQAEKFVGPKGSGKLFETKEAWRAHYAGEYFAPSRTPFSREN
jgi:hypothetical protein